MKFNQVLEKIFANENRMFKRNNTIGIRMLHSETEFFNPTTNEKLNTQSMNRFDLDEDWQEISLCPHCNQTMEEIK